MPAKIELDLLIREATETAELRGHRIGKPFYHRVDFMQVTLRCQDCGMMAKVIRDPAKISGQATTLSCPMEEGR